MVYSNPASHERQVGVWNYLNNLMPLKLFGVSQHKHFRGDKCDVLSLLASFLFLMCALSRSVVSDSL